MSIRFVMTLPRNRSAVCPPNANCSRVVMRSSAVPWAAAYIVPPPRREASPSRNTIGKACSATPAILLLKGGGSIHSRSCALQGSKNRSHPWMRVFLLEAASMPPRSPGRHSGALSARPSVAFSSCTALFVLLSNYRPHTPCRGRPAGLKPYRLKKRLVK